MTLLFNPEPWFAEARCRGLDPERFHPEQGYVPRDIYEICSICPVKQECLEYALRYDLQTGVWGGMCVRDRRQYKRERT